MRPLEVGTPAGSRAVLTAGGASVNVSAGAVAGHRDIVDGMLPELAASVNAVPDRLVAQASDTAGPPVDGGPRAADLLDGMLAHVARSAESSSAYAQIAAGVEDVLHRLSVGDVPSAVRASDLVLGAITGPEPTVARPVLEDTLSPLRVALAGLGRAAADIGAPGGATATRSIISGAPTLVTVVAAPEAPAGLAEVRVLSVASSGTAVTARTFAPDEALGDGTERTIGLVQHLDTSEECTTVIDVGRYPTIAQLAQSINQANVAVRATVAPIGSGGVQLHITSLSSGRSSSVTIVNGEDPPTTSAILGRVVPLVSGRDTLLEVQRPGETAALTQSTGSLVRGVLPGVDVEVRAADPGRTFQVGVQWLSAPTLDRATDLVARAAVVVASAQGAGASATASRVLSALGLASAETAGRTETARGTGAPGRTDGALSGLGAGLTSGGAPVGGTPEDGVDGPRTPLGFPGVRRDERGLPAVNRAGAGGRLRSRRPRHAGAAQRERSGARRRGRERGRRDVGSVCGSPGRAGP